MMLMRMMSGVVLVALVSGCGPRLRSAEEPASAAALPDAPVAKMTVQYEDAKLDAEHKYTADGQFKVGGLFYKDGEPQDATVKVSLKTVEGGTVIRHYDFDLAELAGTVAKVEMWDDGFLTVAIPTGDAPKPGFQTSNQNIKAAGLEIPGQAPSTCYFGKEILDGQIRFALCELQTDAPRLAFVDAVPETAAPQTAPAEPAAAPEAAPASKTN
jgi:hypothetical protein